MKNWLICIVIILGVALFVALKQAEYANEKWKTAMANMKAYDEELSNAEKKSTAYKLTIAQIEASKDSILQELNQTRKELKIKKKNVQTIQYISSGFTRTDTVTMRDTIFKEPSLAIDTLMGDEWYRLNLKLKYPSTIAVTPEFQSKKHIIVSLKKETVNPPKKFWLFRLFQKKHKVLHVDVVEKNPYVKDETSKFVEIIK